MAKTIRLRPVALASKFGDRVSSRLTTHPWLAKSPDLSPLDFWFWGVAMAELRKCPPRTINQLKQTVEQFANSVDPGGMKQVVRSVQTRARVCVSAEGGPFAYKLRKVAKQLIEE